jgi:hypothetical protein
MDKIITQQGKKMSIKKHPGLEMPFCPDCGKQLFCLFDEKNMPLSFGLDLILFCKKCETFWYQNSIYFALRKIYDLKEWGLEISKR